jgi:ATP/ADP translocase
MVHGYSIKSNKMIKYGSITTTLPSLSKRKMTIMSINENDKLKSITSTSLSLSASASAMANAKSTPSMKKTIKKLLPLGAMLFCILFNYTILRDTKDVLVVTAPGSGAEIIPFLKTYVNLPSAIAFTVAYSSLCNKMSSDKVFFIVMAAFLSFFGGFATIIYPNIHLLHPNAFCDVLQAALPVFFTPVVAILRNWTYALFYTLANLWGSVVVSLLFWGFSNEITTVDEGNTHTNTHTNTILILIPNSKC